MGRGKHMKNNKKHGFVLQQVLVSSLVLTGLTVGARITAHAGTNNNPEATPVTVQQNIGSTSATNVVQPAADQSSAQEEANPADTHVGTADTDNNQSANVGQVVTNSADNTDLADKQAKAATADPTGVPAPHPVTVIPKTGNTVHLDNQLVINTNQTTSLKDVTSTSGDYDKTTGIVTITDPSATDSLTATYNNIGTYQGQAISAKVTVSNIIKHTDDHVTPKALVNGSYIIFNSNQVAVIFGKLFGAGIDTYNVAQDDITVTFYDAQGQPVTIDGDGYITVGSLNGPSDKTGGVEYVNYTDNSSTPAYVTANSVVSALGNPNGTNQVFGGKSSDFTDVLGSPTSENGAITFQLLR